MCSGEHSEEAQAAMAAHNAKVIAARESVDRISDHVRTNKADDIAWATVKLADLQSLLDMIGWYEQGISWATECTHCAGLWEENCDQWHTIQELQKRLKGRGVDNRPETSTDRVDSPIVKVEMRPISESKDA